MYWISHHITNKKKLTTVHSFLMDYRTYIYTYFICNFYVVRVDDILNSCIFKTITFNAYYRCLNFIYDIIHVAWNIHTCMLYEHTCITHYNTSTTCNLHFLYTATWTIQSSMLFVCKVPVCFISLRDETVPVSEKQIKIKTRTVKNNHDSKPHFLISLIITFVNIWYMYFKGVNVIVKFWINIYSIIQI